MAELFIKSHFFQRAIVNVNGKYEKCWVLSVNLALLLAFCCGPILNCQSHVQVYILTDRWFFKVMSRAELEDQMNEIRMSASDSAAIAAPTSAPSKPAADAPKPTGIASLKLEE